jgi:hypothetical protein
MRNLIWYIFRIVDSDEGIYTCKLVADGHTKNMSIDVTVVADPLAQTGDNLNKRAIKSNHNFNLITMFFLYHCKKINILTFCC